LFTALNKDFATSHISDTALDKHRATVAVLKIITAVTAFEYCHSAPAACAARFTTAVAC
jgi:hypothetical protein